MAVTAQDHPYKVRFSHEIEAAVAAGDMRPSRAALLYSLLGDYHMSITYSDIPVSWGVDTVDMSSYDVATAYDVIMQEAADHQIVIISENHLKPQHRIFASRIISGLANLGFGHLGLETLTSVHNANSPLDSMLMERGYPLDSPLTGTYTMEPQMANLVRVAIRQGYQLFSYERSEKIKGKDRDEIQADNIIRYLSANPKSKLVIVCGFHHAVESDRIKRGEAYWMAKYIKDRTGIDPLTVYQDNFTEKIIHNQHPSLLVHELEEPSVWVDEMGQVASVSAEVDIEVMHPRTHYKNGRPHWLYKTTAHQAVELEIDSEELQYPLIASAYPAGQEDSVPLDRVEVKHKYDQRVLVLLPGIYTLVLFDGEHTKSLECIVR